MQIQFEAEYIGQRLEGMTAYSERTKSVVRRNWLAISVATDDGDVAAGRMFLPDGELGEPAAVAVRGQRVRCTLSSFQVVKGANVMVFAAVAPTVQEPKKK